MKRGKGFELMPFNKIFLLNLQFVVEIVDRG
jgi:hypothetical protein